MIDGIPTRTTISMTLMREINLRKLITHDLCTVAQIGCLVTVTPLMLTIIYVAMATNWRQDPKGRIEVSEPTKEWHSGGVIDEGWQYDNKNHAPVAEREYK